MTYLLRNPRTLGATVFNAIFIGLLTLALFYKSGDLSGIYDYSVLDIDGRLNYFHRGLANWIGISFLMANNLMFPSLMVVIIQMPLQVPVFKRELMNKMYTPTVYFFGRILSGITLQMAYPVILVLIVYFGLGIDNSAGNFFLWFSLALQQNLVGCGLGYFCGVVFDNDTSARAVGQFSMLLFMLTSGALNNASTYIPFIDQLQYISPNRYAVEGFFRSMLRNNLV